MLLTLFIATNIFSQNNWPKGNIILKNGDTLRGYVRIPVKSRGGISFGKTFTSFKKTRDQKKKKYNHQDIDKIIFKYSETEIAIHEYLKINDKKYELFKLISSGKNKLYSREIQMQTTSMGAPVMGGAPTMVMNSGIYTNIEYYILKESKQIVEPILTYSTFGATFRESAKKAFYDCPGIVNKIQNKTYRKNDIFEMFDEYNNCK